MKSKAERKKPMWRVSPAHYETSPYLTDPLATMELQNPSHNVPELHKIRPSPNFEALIL